MSISKTASRSTVTPGEAVDYTITVTNTGTSTYAAASLQDDLTRVLANATYNGDGTATRGTVSYNASVLSWTGALTPGDFATISYTVTVRDPDPGDKRLINSVVSSTAGNNCTASSIDPLCTATVQVLVPGLTITKTADKDSAAPGTVIGYTITATNSGATPLAAATFTDALAGVVDDAAYNSDAAASSGAVQLSGNDLSWTGALVVGGTVTLTYSVTVHAADTGDDLVTNVVTSTTRGNNCLAGNDDTRCTSTVPVARLTLAQSFSDATTTPGSLLGLGATFTNTGQVAYTGISVVLATTDISDDATSTGNQTASSGTLTLSATALTWTGSIPVGGLVTITGDVLVNDPDLGNKIITGALTSSAPGNNCAIGSLDSRCVAAATVLVPELTIVKSANKSSAAASDVVQYTVTIHNSGQTAYTGALVDDSLAQLLDEASYNGDATTSQGALTFTSPVLSWTGNLAVGGTATITYTVTLNADAGADGDKTLVNTVSSDEVGSTCPTDSTNPACASVVVVLTPGLSIEKLASTATATLGSTITFTVTVTNIGQTAYPAAEFSDPLGSVLDDATYNGATQTRGSTTYIANVLRWTGALSPGQTAIITYTLTISNVSDGDPTLATTISSPSTANNCKPGAQDGRCTAIVTLVGMFALTFTKTANVTAATHGGVVSYTVTAVNVTNSPIAANFADSLVGVLDDADYNNDASSAVGVVSYTEPNLTWAGTVPANGQVTVTYSVTVHGTTTGGQVLSNVLTSTLPTSSNDCLTTGDPRCTSTVPVAGLAIQQHYAETSTTPGSVVHLSSTFVNTGGMPYLGITISSPTANVVDDATPNGDQTASSGSLTLTETAIIWTGDIPVGGTVTVTGTLTVLDPDPGNRSLTGTLSSAALGNNCPTGGGDPQCTATLPVLLPRLTVSKTANVTFVVPGGNVGYTITVHNTGETDYAGAVVTDDLTGALDDAAYNGDAVATRGEVSLASEQLIWTGGLAAGQTATITYSITANRPDLGDKTVVNRVSSTNVGSTCPPDEGGAACVSVVAVLTPSLTITSVASSQTALPGSRVSYTVVATNTGQTPYPAADLSVPLGGVLDDATYNGDATATSGSVGLVGQAVVWGGTLAPTAAVTVTYSVTVDQPVPPTGDFRLSQTVTSTSQGSTCPLDGDDPRCSTEVNIASMHILNSSDVATTKPTGVVRNTVVVTNTGQVPYVGITITDAFAGSLDDATYNGDATATSGSLIIIPGSGQVVWTGDLPVGGSMTVTGSLTVNNPDLGNHLMATRVTTEAPATNCPIGSLDEACVTSVPVLTPALSISKAASATTVSPGEVVTYTITVTNTGPTPYTAAKVRDSLEGVEGDATYQGDGTATSGSVAFAGSTLTWTGDLAVGGASVVITYSVKVNNPDLGGKVMVNAVTSDELGSSCPTGSSEPGCSTLVSVLIPALHMKISSDRTTTVPGEQVGYTVTLKNDGQTPYQGASASILLVGALDDAGYAGDGTATNGTLTYTAPTLVWTGDLAVGATTTISYVLTVKDPDTGNHVVSTGLGSDSPGALCTLASPCTNDVVVLLPGLAVSTTADVANAEPGDQVTITTTLDNTGQTPYIETTLTTNLSNVIDDATFDGTADATVGVATYDAPVLSWVGTLPVGSTAVITYSVVIRDPDPGNKVLSATVVAPGQGSTCQADSTDQACTATVAVLIPALTMTKTASAASTTPGGTVGYTIVLTNSGATPYVGAVVTDSLSGVFPDAVYNADAVAVGGGTLGYAEPNLTWTGDLPVQASVTITYSITIKSPDPGDKHLVNTVSSAVPGSSCPLGSNNPACTAVVQVLVPSLTITKTADKASVTAGDTVAYTVTVSNVGETAYAPATFADPLDGVLDDATYSGDGHASQGTVSYTDGTLSWSGPLGIGETATITYSVNVIYPDVGNRVLSNTVASNSPGSNCATAADPRCTSTVQVLVPALTISKTADASQVVAGGRLTYTIVATNTGESDYSAATLTDSLAGVLDDADYNNDAKATVGQVSYSAPTLSWNGALPQGASVVVTYSVTADVVDTGDAILTNDVVSPALGSTCPAGVPPAWCTTSVPVAPRTISLSDLTSSFTLSGMPNTTVGVDGAVTMTVTTNSPGGYRVTVQSEGAELTGTPPGNGDSIPIGDLQVRDSTTAPFRAMSSQTSLVVGQNDGPSGPGGDAVSNDYRVDIPFVESDTYSTTLDYIAIAQ